MRIKSPVQFVTEVLADGLWHTTSLDRFAMIQQSGGLKVDPPLPDSERHKTSNGAANYPYVRTLGGISLFSFSGFSEEEYRAACPLSNWEAFVPVWHQWTSAIWIEIDRATVRLSIIEAEALLERWKAEEAYRHTIMPRIEAAHIGDLPARAFRSAFLVDKQGMSEWTVVPHPFKASPSAPAPP